MNVFKTSTQITGPLDTEMIVMNNINLPTWFWDSHGGGNVDCKLVTDISEELIASISTLSTEMVSSFSTLVTTYTAIRRHNPENNH
jgi:hypothetical protein